MDSEQSGAGAPSSAGDDQPAVEPVSDADARATVRRTVWRWVRDLLLIGAAFMAINAWQTRELPRGRVPKFALHTIDGGIISSAQLAGKPTLLLFWAPWCGVCRVQSQNVSWVEAMLGDRAQVISIATSYRTPGEVRAYMQAQDVDYPVLLGSDAVARTFAVRAFPTAFFVDSHGALTRATTGYTTTLGLLWRLLLP